MMSRNGTRERAAIPGGQAWPRACAIGLGTAAAVLSAVAISSGRAHANLVGNSGFETENSPPSGPPPGWNVTGTGIIIDTLDPNTAINPASLYDVEFTALPTDPSPGVLSQLVPTVPNTQYGLTFALQDQGGDGTESFTVTFGGFTATLAGDPASFGEYVNESLTIPASAVTGSLTTLSFEGTNDVTAWNLDDVSMPEPASGVLLAVASLLGLSARGRTRRP